MLLLSAMLSALSANPVRAQSSARSSAESTERLIRQLDADRYDDREQAGRELVGIGSAAIESLAQRLVDGSPEVSWRIRDILEEIAVASSEETLFQIAAILTVRFRDQQSDKLERLWKTRIRKSAIAELRSAGVEVVDPVEQLEELGFANAPFQNRVLLGQGNVVVLNRFEARPAVNRAFDLMGGLEREMKLLTVEDQPPADSSADSASKALPEESMAADELSPRGQLAAELDDIINGTLEENRRRVYQGRPQRAGDVRTATAPEQFNVFMANPGGAFQARAIELTFGVRWKGELDKLAGLEVFEVAELTLEDIQLTPELISLMSEIPVRSLNVRRCRFDEQSLAEVRWPRASQAIGIEQDGNINTLLAALAGSPCNVITLADCELDEETIQQLRQTEAYALHLSRVNVTPKSFESIKSWKQLRVLGLAACRFDAMDYLELQAARPELNLNFVPAAFLGVSGQLFVDDLQITRVVEGSAADAAGVRVGDVVVKVGDRPAENFEILKLLIAQYKIGDEISITVQRDGRTEVLKAILGENEGQLLQ